MFGGYQPPKATVYMPKLDLDMHGSGQYDYRNGQKVQITDPTPELSRRASQAARHQPTCVLCGIMASPGDAHTVRGVTVHAHARCIQNAARKFGVAQKSVNKAMSKAYPAVLQKSCPIQNCEEDMLQEALDMVSDALVHELRATYQP